MRDCALAYKDSLGPQSELTDADPNTGGFQMDLYDGVNYVMLRVYQTAFCQPGERYFLAITRAEGSVTLTRPNRPAVGAPRIDGLSRNSWWQTYHPWVGNTLDADVGDISDRDGWDTATFSYQWFSDGAQITGATGSSYMVTNAELGKSLKVEVSFTDDRGTEESVTSEATETVKLPNAVPTGKPIIRGTLEVGQTLTADVSGISDANGLTTATFTYEWMYFRGPVRDGEEYLLVAADEGQGGMWLRVTYTDDAGHQEKLDSDTIWSVAASSNSPATGVPTISGTAQVGETLTADTSGIADSDGLTNVSYGYQWIRSDGTADTDIQNATGSSYTLAADDEGKTIKVKVSFTDDADSEETLTSTATETVRFAVQQQIVNSPATGAPAVTGTAEVGKTLTADTSGIADADGLSGATFSYQWITNDGNADTDIAGATDSTYVLAADDEGKTIKVKVSFTDDASNAETLTSAATGTVLARPNSSATGAPTISGTAQVGEVLTADTSGIADSDGLTNASYSYQWISNGGTSDTDITGATNSTYTLVAADESKTIKVKVSFTDDEDNDETLTSTATASVISASEGASGQSESEGVSYITVAVTEDTSDPNNIVTNFTVTWSDSEACSTNYNGYLNVKPSTRPGHETTGSQHHLGSTASDGTQMTKGLTGVQGAVEGFNVEVYCGTDSSGRMVSRVAVPWSDGRPKPGTYSSEPPLSAMSVSQGTLTPTFNSYTSRYTVPDVANNVTRITITATPKDGYSVDLFETSGDGVFALIAYSIGPWGPPSGLSPDCGRSMSDTLGPLIELTDADPNTPGFQVDMYDGENHVHVRVYPTTYCDLGEGYNLAITRAEGSVSVVRPNRSPVGLPHIGPAYTRGPCVGCTMEADVSYISDRDGWDTTTFSYQWLADDAEITGATGSSFTVTDAELGKTLKVRVTFTDDRGTEETVTSDATKVVKLPNVEPTGKPVILGTLEVGQTLTADASGISDPNGMTNATFSYEWANFHGPVTDGEEYTLVDRDAGDNYRVLVVTYTDDAGHEERVHSESIGMVAPSSNSPATGAPTITGTAQVGETLTVDTSGVADADGLANVSYSYQWVSNDGTSDTDITGATDSTYTLVAIDEGKTIKVKVTFTDDAANEETLASEATVAIAAMSSPNAGAPTIKGTAKVGETLTVDTTGMAQGLVRATFSYQWVSNDGSADTDIPNATDSAYILVASDEGKTMKVRVSFTNNSGNGETLTSAATAAVAAEPPTRPQGLTGIVAHDAVSLTWDDPGDATITSYQILRRDRALHSNGDFQVHVDDTGSAAAAYIDRDVSPEGSYVYRIKARNAAGLSGRSTYFRADTPSAPAQNSPATGAPAITGTVQVGEMLTADLSGIADADGLSGVTFSYQWISNDGTVDTDIVGATGSIYTLAASDEGKSIKVRVTFTDDAGYGESLSSAATAAVASQNSPGYRRRSAGGRDSDGRYFRHRQLGRAERSDFQLPVDFQ